MSSLSPDHSSLINTLNYGRGLGLWKFNNSLIEKMDFGTHVKTHFNDIKSNFEKKTTFLDQSECELLKFQIRNFAPFSLEIQKLLVSYIGIWKLKLKIYNKILKYKNINKKN